jgi:hypothetical protein
MSTLDPAPSKRPTAAKFAEALESTNQTEKRGKGLHYAAAAACFIVGAAAVIAYSKLPERMEGKNSGDRSQKTEYRSLPASGGTGNRSLPAPPKVLAGTGEAESRRDQGADDGEQRTEDGNGEMEKNIKSEIRNTKYEPQGTKPESREGGGAEAGLKTEGDLTSSRQANDSRTDFNPSTKEPIQTEARQNASHQLHLNSAMPDKLSEWRSKKRELQNNTDFKNKGALIYQLPDRARLEFKRDGVVFQKIDSFNSRSGCMHSDAGHKIEITLIKDDDSEPISFEWMPVAEQVDVLE